jgi:RimJ/RimL family protein N-acetyltransferase
MNAYKVLNKQEFIEKTYSIVPIRFEDRMDIMKWRNEQLYHLRQQKPLTSDEQDNYFKTIVSKLLDQEKPSQLLFSFLENGVCIGYGGLVHINWVDKNAEISFIMDTKLENNRFDELWTAYLSLIEQLAFAELKFHKIYTYAFDLRPHLYLVLEQSGYSKEAVLKEHCLFENRFIDVLIHSKINRNIILRQATEEDKVITFEWANNSSIREYSVNKNTIKYEDHLTWFLNKIKSDNCLYLIAEIDKTPIGSIRFDIEESSALISYLLDPKYHGKGIGRILLFEGVKRLLQNSTIKKISGMVFKDNIASMKAFSNLGYNKIDKCVNFVIFEKNVEL